MGDKGMFSDANLDALGELGCQYVLALLDRSDQEGDDAIKLAFKGGLVRADYSWLRSSGHLLWTQLVVRTPARAGAPVADLEVMERLEG